MHDSQNACNIDIFGSDLANVVEQGCVQVGVTTDQIDINRFNVIHVRNSVSRAGEGQVQRLRGRNYITAVEGCSGSAVVEAAISVGEPPALSAPVSEPV